MLEGRNAGLDARVPAHRPLEPPLLLPLGLLLGEPPSGLHRDLLDPRLLCFAHVRRGVEATIGRGGARRATKRLLVLRNRRHEAPRVGGVAVLYVVVTDDAVLGPVDADEPAKLGGLVGLALANGRRVLLEETQDLAFDVAVSAEYAGLCLRDDLAHQRSEVAQLLIEPEHACQAALAIGRA